MDKLFSPTNSKIRNLLTIHPKLIAPQLLGGILTINDVSLKIVEVEAYGSDENGPWPDPAGHCYPGITNRNKVMFGPPGHLYIYLSYGIHLCANITCGNIGVGSGILLRAGEVIKGVSLAQKRRKINTPIYKLAAGPGNLGQTLGLNLNQNGLDLLTNCNRLRLIFPKTPLPNTQISSGVRIGISRAKNFPWRFWITNHPCVSK